MGRPKNRQCDFESLEQRLLLSATALRAALQADAVPVSSSHHAVLTSSQQARRHHNDRPAPLPALDASQSATSALTAAPAVVRRSLFYNQSVFDGNNSAPQAADDAAIATDKVALFPNGVAQPANFTSYSRGINGLMIDLVGVAGSLTTSDFDFSVGNSTSGTQWSVAPAPASNVVRTDTPAVGTTRIEFTWANRAIVNQWLRVTVKSDVNTGLAAPDIFYFGNLTGAANPTPIDGLFVVSAADVAAAANDLHTFLNPADITNSHDYNRDGKVDATDEVIATNSAASYAAIAQFTAPSTTPAPTVSVVSRLIFYNGSIWDGNDQAANAADDLAIAADKHPLLPGGFAQFPNITNYTRGIDGLMIDIAGLSGSPTLADFAFAVGNTTDTAQWTATPAPTGMLVRGGSGASGSTRFEFTWASGTITNEWLRVTTLSNANTGLTSPDVFYYGNLIGFSTGAANAANTQFVVTTKDIQYAANDLHTFLNPATPANAHDYNRDGKVDATDEVIASMNAANAPAPSLINLDFTGMVWSPAIVITQGGTYSGNWQSLNASVPAVVIQTTDPVVITNSKIRGMGDLIMSGVPGVNLTVTNTTGTALNPNRLRRAPGRFISLISYASADIENNTLTGTSGIELNGYGGRPTSITPVKVLRNSALNIDGRYSDGAGGFMTGANDNDLVQFVQINDSIGLPGADIGWNQVINLPDQSRVEDNISIHLSSGTATTPILIHDNYIQGAYPVDPAHNNNFSGGGIMLADGDGALPTTEPAFVQAFNNIVISTSNYGLAIAAGHDNSIHDNIVVSSGLLPDGTPIKFLNVGIYIWNSHADLAFANNTIGNNVVGFAIPHGRNDYWLPDATTQTNNTALPDPVTLQTEHNYLVVWLQKLATGSVLIGAA